MRSQHIRRTKGAAPVELPAAEPSTEKKRVALTTPDAPLDFRPLARSTIKKRDLELLANNEHKQPHRVLGLHPVAQHGVPATAARALFPEAVEVSLVVVLPPSAGADDRFRRVPMTRVDDAGVFEAVIPKLPKNSRYHFEVKEAGGFVHAIEDPYRFAPTADALSIQLFGEGTLEQTTSLLGAREKTIDGTKGYAFTVWAPNAKRVSIVGDFNDWDGRRNPMRELAGGIFEIFMPKVEPGAVYKFEVLKKDGSLVHKSDPFARRTMMRPDTASITYSSNYQWNDAAWVTKRAASNPLSQAVSTYEVHLPSWKRGPWGQHLNYRKLADELVPHLKEHNFTHVELIGLLEHPFDGSLGYQVTGYYSPTARHGTPDDFKYFVDKLHQAGIGVLLDWVPGHFAVDEHGLAEFDGTHLFNHPDPRKGAHPEWGTRIFDYERKQTRSFLLGSLLHAIDEFHLDGARVDAVASMLYLDYGRKEGEWVPNKNGGKENLEAISFLKQVSSVVGKKRPGVMLVAEESTAFPKLTRPIADGGLGFNLKWNMGWMNDTLRWFQRGYKERKDLTDLTHSFSFAFQEKAVCALSHDEVSGGKNSLLEKMPGDDWQKFANLRLLYGWMWSYPGHKLLMMGQEFGQREEWDPNRGLRFNELENGRHRGASALVADLNALYQSEPALHEDQFNPENTELTSRDPFQVALSVTRKAKNAGDSIVFVHNMAPEIRGAYRVGVDGPGTYGEILNTDLNKYGGSDVKNAPVKAEKIPMHGKPYSIELTLPPLATIALKKIAPTKIGARDA